MCFCLTCQRVVGGVRLVGLEAGSEGVLSSGTSQNLKSITAIKSLLMSDLNSCVLSIPHTARSRRERKPL